jgi:DNA primase
MLKIDDTIIEADTEDVLKILKSELYQKGIDRFHIFRRNGDNIQTNCPFHKNGQERKPSFGVNGNLNKCHCFTCGWAGRLNDLVSELFGYNDSGTYGRKWLIRRFNTIEIESRPNLLENKLNRNLSQKTNNLTYITDEELDKYRYIHPYMYERGLTDELIERFDVGYDVEKQEITFPIKDLKGGCVFVASRSVRTKFFRLPQGINKPIYCANEFIAGAYKTAYITESFLNCLTCWKFGKPAMAMIGTGNTAQYKILESLPVREYVLCFDPDDAGRKATQRFKKNVKGKIIKEIIYEEDGKDINDLQENFLNLPINFV